MVKVSPDLPDPGSGTSFLGSGTSNYGIRHLKFVKKWDPGPVIMGSGTSKFEKSKLMLDFFWRGGGHGHRR